MKDQILFKKLRKYKFKVTRFKKMICFKTLYHKVIFMINTQTYLLTNRLMNMSLNNSEFKIRVNKNSKMLNKIKIYINICKKMAKFNRRKKVILEHELKALIHCLYLNLFNILNKIISLNTNIQGSIFLIY